MNKLDVIVVINISVVLACHAVRNRWRNCSISGRFSMLGDLVKIFRSSFHFSKIMVEGLN